MNRIIVFVIALIAIGCGKTDVQEVVQYTGPVSEAEHVETFYSENGLVKVKMLAALMQEFEDGDREFPKGIYLEFYDETGRLESTLKANQAHFFQKENKWRGVGDVEVNNTAKKEQLNTEELFWKPADEKIFTDKFVTIRQEGDVIYGTGLEAKQDMSAYTIGSLGKDVGGEMEVNEEN